MLGSKLNHVSKRCHWCSYQIYSDMSARTHIVLPILKYNEQKLGSKYGNVTVMYRLLQGISKYIHTIYERFCLQLFVIVTSHIKMIHDSKFPVVHWTQLWISGNSLSILMDHLHTAKKWYSENILFLCISYWIVAVAYLRIDTKRVILFKRLWLLVGDFISSWLTKPCLATPWYPHES